MTQDSAQKLIVDGKFEVLSRIGAGGMGTVYLCRQLGFERVVALKVLHGEDVADAESQARFEREAQALARLKHKNIVSLYGYGMHNGAPYIAMERVEGVSLVSLLARNEPMPIDRVVSIARQLCEALICAHANGIIHRDIKPNNVIVTADGGIKLIDFGLAKLSAKASIKDQGLTEAGAAVGSVQYMSPEQCLGQQIDERADLYALGCLIYHCVTGVPPFGGDHSVAVMHQHVSESLPRIAARAIADSRLGAMQALIDVATAKQRGERYACAADMLDDVNRVAANHSVVSSVSNRPASASAAEIKRNRRPLKIAIAMLACVMLAVAGATIYDTNGSQGKLDSLVAKAQQLADELGRTDYRDTYRRLKLHDELAKNYIAQAELSKQSSEANSLLGKAVLEYGEEFALARSAGLLTGPMLADLVDQVVRQKQWTSEQRRTLACDGVSIYCAMAPEDTGLKRRALERLLACEPADVEVWAREVLNLGVGYATALNRAGRQQEALQVMLRTVKALEPLPRNRVFAISALPFADQISAVEHAPATFKAEHYKRGFELFMSYESDPLYKDRTEHMASYLVERAGQLHRTEDVERILERLDRLKLRNPGKWWDAYITYNVALMHGDIKRAADELRGFLNSPNVDHPFFTELYAAFMMQMGRKDEAQKWQKLAFEGLSDETARKRRMEVIGPATIMLVANGHCDKARELIRASIDLGRPMSAEQEVDALLTHGFIMSSYNPACGKALVEPILKEPLLAVYNKNQHVRSAVTHVLGRAK